MNVINSRSFDIYSRILFPFCNYIRNCIKLNIIISIVFLVIIVRLHSKLWTSRYDYCSSFLSVFLPVTLRCLSQTARRIFEIISPPRTPSTKRLYEILTLLCSSYEMLHICTNCLFLSASFSIYCLVNQVETLVGLTSGVCVCARLESTRWFYLWYRWSAAVCLSSLCYWPSSFTVSTGSM